MLTKYKPYIFLFVIAIIAYWQISFFAFTLKWDVMDVVFPFRYHFSECIQSGYFPFWDPYQQTGTPFFADLQVPTYYPELIITSLFSGYGVYTMHILFIIYVFISSVGAYKLSFFLNNNKTASLFAAIAYSLSGYFIGHGQHFFLLVGAAWIPFVILYYLKLNQNKKLIDVLKTGIFTFLMVSGSYQALSFVLFYFLLALFVYAITKELRNKNYTALFQIIKVNTYLLFVVIVLSLPLIIATIEVLSSVERLESGLSIQEAFNNELSIKAIISFILPFATVKNSVLFGSDISMRNFYFGILPLIFFLSALLKKKSTLEYIFLFMGLILLASTFGDHLPVREFLFNHIPLMNLFKYAPFISVFSLLTFIIISSNYIAQFLENYERHRNNVLIFSFFILIIILFFLAFSIAQSDFSSISIFFNNYDIGIFHANSSYYENIFIQSSFQIIILSAFIYLIFNFKKIKYSKYLILSLFAIEIIASAQLNMLYTVVDADHQPYKIKKDLALYPKKFPIPINGKVILNKKQQSANSPFWRNTYIFSKQVTFDSFSSFKLDSYAVLEDDCPNLRSAALNNHLCYFSQNIFSLNQFTDSNIDPQTDSKYLFFKDSIYLKLSKNIVSHDDADGYEIKQFSPNKIIIETNTLNDQYFTLLQSNYKGWKAYIDNSNTQIYTSNYNYRTIFLPKGKHTIVFEYKNNTILVTYIISNILFFISILILIGLWLFSKTDSKLIYISIPLILIIIITILVYIRVTHKNTHESTHEQLDNRWQKKTPITHYNDLSETEILNQQFDSLNVFAGKRSIYITPETEYFRILNIKNSKAEYKNISIRFKAMIKTKSYTSIYIISQIKKDKSVTGWHLIKLEKQIKELNQWSEVQYSRNYFDLKPTDELNLFLWLRDTNSFVIDNLEVDIYDL